MEVATSATESSSIRPDPPWLRVLRRHLEGRSLSSIFRSLGWSPGKQYWMRRCGKDLRLSVASRIALAAGFDLGTFLAEVATEQGIQPLDLPEKLFRPGRPSPKRRRRRTTSSPSSELSRLRGFSVVSPLPRRRRTTRHMEVGNER